MGESAPLSGPDLGAGVSPDSVREGTPLLGHCDGEAVMLVRAQGKLFATGAQCTHYGGPLAEGLVVGTSVRCPWHHACFELETGFARGPALTPLACYDIVSEAGLLRVAKKRAEHRAEAKAGPSSVVIIGGGAAGAACAETLRRYGYAGPVTIVAEEAPGPVDRPNLSKDYLAGTAPEEWIPLRDAEFYRSMQVELAVGNAAESVDRDARQVKLANGRTLAYGALVLATGGAPRRLPIPGADGPNVFVLRTLADSRAVIARAAKGARAVVIGASFIGLEVAASLRKREVAVHVVGPENIPLARVVGDKLGTYVRSLHEQHGVTFHLGRSPARIEDNAVVLDDGTSLAADFVVLGVGVQPRTALAESAGLSVDRGVVVDEKLCTSDPNIYAAGDIAAYPDVRSGERVRIEHWAVAERQGQCVARNLLGREEAYREVPFFWSAHYDVTLSYVGHAQRWDRMRERGDLSQGKYVCAYERDGKVLAVVSVGDDAASLQAEAAMEAGAEDSLASLVP